MMAYKKKVIDLDTYSVMDGYAIALNEWYKSLRRAGFSVDIALAIVLEKESFPTWILPVKPLEKITDIEYDDDEDE